MNPLGTNTPVETISYVALVFGLTEILKYPLKLKGDVARVQLLGLIIAEFFAFGDTLFGTPTLPTVTLFLVWNTLIRGIILGSAAFGWNGVKTGQQKRLQSGGEDDGAADDGTPLGQAQAAVNEAQNLTSRAGQQLDKIEAGIDTASAVLKSGVIGNAGRLLGVGAAPADPEPETPADAPVLPPDVPPALATGSGPFKEQDKPLIAAILTHYAGFSTEQITTAIQNNPDNVRAALAHIAEKYTAPEPKEEITQ